MSITQPYLSALKSIDKVKASTIISTTALFLNIILNAAFIFVVDSRDSAAGHHRRGACDAHLAHC